MKYEDCCQLSVVNQNGSVGGTTVPLCGICARIARVVDRGNLQCSSIIYIVVNSVPFRSSSFLFIVLITCILLEDLRGYNIFLKNARWMEHHPPRTMKSAGECQSSSI